MTDYVTVVAVDNGVEQSPRQPSASEDTNSPNDSQFITVLSINEHGKSAANSPQTIDSSAIAPTESVTVYRLPGERLGFGLKFQGGTRSTECIQKLFIQSCAADSPASRAKTSWGFLREGDEIVDIDGVAVHQLTRLECVRCLKESNLALRLSVRTGDPAIDSNDASAVSDSVTRKIPGTPPKPPPVPPRKINRRKATKQTAPSSANPAIEDKPTVDNPLLKQITAKSTAIEKSFTPPPDAEFYINLFSDENELKLRAGSESDDTASTISTVIETACVSNPDLGQIAHGLQPPVGLTASTASVDLAKVLNSFALLEQEFRVPPAQLQECLTRLQSPASQLADNSPQNHPYENVTVHVSAPSAIARPAQDYENIRINVGGNPPADSQHPYENVIVKIGTPPTPLPRTTAVSNVEVKPAPSLIPVPRTKMPLVASNTTPTKSEPKSELPRLVHFVPKIVATTPANRNSESAFTINNAVPAPIKKCIRLPDDDNSAATRTNYAESSDSCSNCSSDEEEEKSYEPNAQRVIVGAVGTTGDNATVGSITNCAAADAESACDTRSTASPSSSFDDDDDDCMEDGEKLGPPSIVDGPGPSEAYFNFPWSTNMLPTIGEVEEEFSSLEPMTDHKSSLIKIDTGADTVDVRPAAATEKDADVVDSHVSDNPSSAHNNSNHARVAGNLVGRLTADNTGTTAKPTADGNNNHDAIPTSDAEAGDFTPNATDEDSGDNTLPDHVPGRKLNAANITDTDTSTSTVDNAAVRADAVDVPTAEKRESNNDVVDIIGEPTTATTTIAVARPDATRIIANADADDDDAAASGAVAVSDAMMNDNNDVTAPSTLSPVKIESDDCAASTGMIDADNDAAADPSNGNTLTIPDALNCKPQTAMRCAPANVNGIASATTTPPTTLASFAPLPQHVQQPTTTGPDGQQHHHRLSTTPAPSASPPSTPPSSPGDSLPATAPPPPTAQRRPTSVGEEAATAEAPPSSAPSKFPSTVAKSESSSPLASQPPQIVPRKSVAAGLCIGESSAPATESPTSPAATTLRSSFASSDRRAPNQSSQSSEPEMPGAGRVSKKKSFTGQTSFEDTSSDSIQDNADTGRPQAIVESIGRAAPATAARSAAPVGAITVNEPQLRYDDPQIQLDIQRDAGPSINNMDSIAGVSGLATSTSSSATSSSAAGHSSTRTVPTTSKPFAASKPFASEEPPTFSRLPPDGHEFPPNFCEPIVVTSPNGSESPTGKQPSNTDSTDHHQQPPPEADFSAAPPPLPKSGPPTQSVASPPAASRKLYRQDLHIAVDEVTAPASVMVVQSTKKTWCPAVLEDKTVRKEIMITAKNGHIADPAWPSSSSAESPTAIVHQRRRSIEQHDAFKKFDAPRKQIGALPTSWRKDEKSERSVRDKIAMFSADSASSVDLTDSSGPSSSSSLQWSRGRAQSSFTLNRSTDNLLDSSPATGSSGRVDAYAKKAQSVEHLDEMLLGSGQIGSASSFAGSSYDYASYMADSSLSSTSSSTASSQLPTRSSATPRPARLDAYMSKAYSVENLLPASAGSPAALRRTDSEAPPSLPTSAIPPSYASLPRANKPPSVARTTSFSGAHSTAGSNYDDRRRTSISSLLEQRKKSMSKLRGLIIPEKFAVGRDITGPVLHDLPEIKSHLPAEQPLPPASLPPQAPTVKREPVIANPRHYTPAYQTEAQPSGAYRSIFANSTIRTPSASQGSRPSAVASPFKKPLQPIATPAANGNSAISNASIYIMAPVKPPRTSLSVSGRSPQPFDDSDTDSVFSSKVSGSPPGSPTAGAAPGGKFALTRTLSSETNTSVASSTASTLTSGSQASCSSLGSTPSTIDLSRRISKSSSSESYANRKSILALAKCRSGKDDTQPAPASGPAISFPSTQLGHRPHQQRRAGHDDEDSTDGYDEDADIVQRSRAVAPKPKARHCVPIGSLGAGVGASTHRMQTIQAPVSSVPVSQPINYRLVSAGQAADLPADAVINVATYVEVVAADGADKHGSGSSGSASPIGRVERSRANVASVAVATPVLAAKPITASPIVVESNDMAKWVRSEAVESFARRSLAAHQQPSVLANIQKFNKEPAVLPPKTARNSAALQIASKAIERSAKTESPSAVAVSVRSTSSTIIGSRSIAATSNNHNSGSYHERFSSLDSLASSSSSGISSSQASSLLDAASPLQQSPDGGAGGDFAAFGSNNHSLITPADLQLIIEEADPPLLRPDAFVVVLQRESPECSVGVTLAGGADYETKEITVYRVLGNSPAYKDGRLRKGDRILSVNGLSMRGLTHRESVAVLKTPRLEVVMVVTRSESVRPTAERQMSAANGSFARSKRTSMGSLTSLHGSDAKTAGPSGGKAEVPADAARRKLAYHKLSQSLDMDLDMVSNEGSSIYDENKSMDGAEDSTGSSMGDDAVFGMKTNEGRAGRVVEIYKDNCGLGLAIEGGMDSPAGHCPLTVKKVFMGGAAEKTGLISVGDVILAINDFNTEHVTRVQAWNYMKSLPGGSVKFCLA